jgi:predicted RND superfamily exporter protein
MYLSNKQPPRIKTQIAQADLQSSPWYLRAWPFVLGTAAVMLIVCGMGTSRLQTAVGLHDLFPSDAKVLRDYRWLEDQIGPLIPIEVVLDIPQDTESGLLPELQYVAILEEKLLKVDGVDSVLSALNFAPPIPSRRESHSFRGIASAKVYESRLRKSLPEYESFRMLHQGEKSRSWRLSARIAGGVPQSYPPLLAQIDQAASAAIDEMGANVTATISGGVPLAAKTQQRLLNDLGVSFMTAVLLIGITMAVILKNPLAGIVTLVPNVAPALVVFGTMGWFGWPAEIGGIMTASAVLGIAVDDSLHLILSFRAAHAQGLERQAAVLSAIGTCRPAIVQTSLVCGLGMLVFAFSPFVPIQRFAWLMFTLLVIALIADLVLMPALLYSPLGRFFVARKRSECNN